MRAPALRELQRLFWEAITSAPGETRAAPPLLGVISASEQLAPLGRVSIYARMYWGRILDVLRQDFARTAELLGDERFAALARDFLAERPSRHPSIAHVGDGFADFLAARAAVVPLAADLARLEWARSCAFAAPDAAALRLADLAGLPAEEWADLRLTLVPSATLLALRFPVQRLLEPGGMPPGDEATVLRIWRRGELVFHASADVTERIALERVRAGACFAAVAEVCRDPHEAAALLARWLEDEVLLRPAALRASAIDVA